MESIAILIGITKETITPSTDKRTLRLTGIYPLNSELVLAKIKTDLTASGAVLVTLRPATKPLPNSRTYDREGVMRLGGRKSVIMEYSEHVWMGRRR